MKDNSGKVILALLAGASAGVITGLLMAPDTGEQTRTGIKKWANKLSKDLEKNLQTGFDELKKMSEDTMSKVSGSASDLADSVKNATGGSSSGGSSSGGSSSGSASSGSSSSGGSSSGGSSTGGSTGGGSTAGGAGNTGGIGSTGSGTTGGTTGGSTSGRV